MTDEQFISLLLIEVKTMSKPNIEGKTQSAMCLFDLVEIFRNSIENKMINKRKNKLKKWQRIKN